MTGPQTPYHDPTRPTGPSGPPPGAPAGRFDWPSAAGPGYAGPQSAGPQYAGPSYGGPSYGWPGHQGPPRSTSTTGPKVTLAIGVVLLIAAVVVGVTAGKAIAGLLPTDVLRIDGSQGSGVVGVVDAPGRAEVPLVGDHAYSLYLITDQGREADVAGRVTVSTLDGANVPTGGAAMSGYVQMGTTRAELVGTVEIHSSDMYVIDAPDTTDGLGGRIYVTEGAAGSGILGGVVGTLAAAGLGLIGFVLALVGAIMWGVRRGNARRAGLR